MIFSGVGTKPIPFLKTLISASVMFLDDKLKTFSETNFPSILQVAGSVLHALECSPSVCVVVLGFASGMSSSIKLAKILAKSYTLSCDGSLVVFSVKFTLLVILVLLLFNKLLTLFSWM